MIRIEHNVETGEIKEIELTAEEIAIFEAEGQKITDEIAAMKAAEAAKVAEKAALLAKLGITADEAKLLLS